MRAFAIQMCDRNVAFARRMRARAKVRRAAFVAEFPDLVTLPEFVADVKDGFGCIAAARGALCRAREWREIALRWATMEEVTPS